MNVLGIFILIIIYAAIGSSYSRREKRERDARQQMRQSQPVRKKNARPVQPESAGEGEDPCHEGQLRPAQPSMRLVTSQTLEGAGEGEDPCHVGEAPVDETESAYDSPVYAPVDAHTLAGQVLSGVIMSEVLKRPAERRIEQRMRRRM